MSLRATALRWLAAEHRVRDADILASRHYPAEQSWTGRAAWWLQVPVARVEAPGERVFHLLCERPDSRPPSFHYLAVPASVLRERMPDLDRPGDGRTVSLFLSAEPDSLFRDERGPGRLDFAPFARSEPDR